VWRQEDAGKCSEDDKDRMVQTRTVTDLVGYNENIMSVIITPVFTAPEAGTWIKQSLLSLRPPVPV